MGSNEIQTAISKNTQIKAMIERLILNNKYVSINDM